MSPSPGRNMFGVARDFRTTHGEDAFKALAKVVFTDADEDKSGTVDVGEIRNMMRKLGMLISEEQAAAVLTKYDADGNGTLDQKEWLGLVSDLVDGSLDASGDVDADGAGTDEISALRKENRLLKARVEKLEAQMALVVERLGMPRAPSRKILPREEQRQPSSRDLLASSGNGRTLWHTP